MLNKLKNRKQGGFTIIEVLIVLAIAGLILLIVFLAVPNLQRTSRNTQRKNDASAIGGAIANFISNNNGSVPTALAADTTANTLDVCLTGGGSNGGATACTGNVETAKLGYYTPANIYTVPAAATPVAPTVVAVGASEGTTKISSNTIVIATGQDCNLKASPRTAAVYFVSESGSGNGSLQCNEQ